MAYGSPVAHMSQGTLEILQGLHAFSHFSRSFHEITTKENRFISGWIPSFFMMVTVAALAESE